MKWGRTSPGLPYRCSKRLVFVVSSFRFLEYFTLSLQIMPSLNNTRSAISRICRPYPAICPMQNRSTLVKSIIINEKMIDFTKRFHSDVIKHFKLSDLVFVDLRMQSNNCLQYNTIQYNTIYLFSIKHITMFIAYTLTYINVVITTTIFLRSI